MGQKKHNNAEYKGNAGFSLVELAVVILLSSLAVTPLYQILLVKPLNNGSSIDLALSGLAEHLRVHGTFPCPADPALGPSDANYGTAGDCLDGGGVTVVQKIAIGAVPVDTLRIAMDCIGQAESDTENTADDLELALGRNVSRKNIRTTRDTLKNANSDDDTDYKLDITRCITNDDMLDEYGNKLLYAVEIAATTEAPGGNVFDPFATASKIEVHDINGNTTTRKRPIFVVLSHGKNGNGAVNAQGVAQAECSVIADSKDEENCDGDAVFRYMPISKDETENYFDDKVDFSLAGFEREDNQWNWAGDTDARNLSFGNPSLTDTRLIVGDGNLLLVPNDKLVINNGNLLAGDDTGLETFDIEVIVGIPGTDNAITTPKFCYPFDPLNPLVSDACCNPNTPCP